MRIISIFVLLGISLIAFGQQPPSAQASPRYDRSIEATFKGSILEVRERPCAVSRGIGSHLLIRTADGKAFEVHLGTTRFVHEYGLSFQRGETVEITGVKVVLAGTDAILARKMKRGTEEFVFRDSEGNPIW
jgi:hypothetical protein